MHTPRFVLRHGQFGWRSIGEVSVFALFEIDLIQRRREKIVDVDVFALFSFIVVVSDNVDFMHEGF